MEVISIIPKTEESEKQYIVKVTEKELDKISGIAEVEHIEGRIQVGQEIKLSAVYDLLDNFARDRAKLNNAKAILRNMADSIDKVLPKENP